MKLAAATDLFYKTRTKRDRQPAAFASSWAGHPFVEMPGCRVEHNNAGQAACREAGARCHAALPQRTRPRDPWRARQLTPQPMTLPSRIRLA